MGYRMRNTIGQRKKSDSERSCERQERDGEEETGTRVRSLPLHYFSSFFLFFFFFPPTIANTESTILIELPQYHVPEACRDPGQWRSRM